MSGNINVWHGHFYLPDDDRLDYFQPPSTRSEQFGPLYTFRADLPWDCDIEEASKRYPMHAETLKTWSEIWQRSFPDWREEYAKMPAYKMERCGPVSTPVDRKNESLSDFLSEGVEGEEDGLPDFLDDDLSGSKSDDDKGELESFLTDVIKDNGKLRWQAANRLLSYLHEKRPQQVENKVDPLINVIKSAQGVIAFRHLVPQVSVVNAGGDNCLLVGFDDEGYPKFEKTRRAISASEAERAWNDVYNNAFQLPEIWRIPALDKYREGHVIGTHSGGPEDYSASSAADSLSLLSAIIADMALQEIREVVIEETFLIWTHPMPRRWIVDIRGCGDPLRAKRLLQDAIPELENWKVTVTPKFNAEYRQRMFVLDGKLIGSTPVDTIGVPDINGHPLSQKVANAATGSCEIQEDLSMALQQAAQEIAAILREQEVTEYALDLEMAGSKVVIAGIYPLTVSDTYSFDISNLMKAISAEQERLVDEVGKAVSKIDGPIAEYSQLLMPLIDKFGEARLAMLIAVKFYHKSGYHEHCITEALKQSLREVLWEAHRRVKGGLLDEAEIDRLGIIRWGSSIISDWLRSVRNDSGYLNLAVNWIAEKRGLTLAPVD